MRKILVGTLILIFGVGIGMGAMSVISKWWQPVPVQAASPVNDPAAFQRQTKTPGAPEPQRTPVATLADPAWSGDILRMGQGMMGGWANGAGRKGWGMGHGMMGQGMMGGWDNSAGQGIGERGQG